MKKYIITLIALLMAVFAYSNSVFSFDGFPVTENGYDTYSLGMGESGTGDLFRINFSLNNPSLSTSIPNVMFSSAISASKTTYSSDIYDYSVTEASIPYFNIVAPIKQSRIFFSFSNLISGNYESFRTSEMYIEDDTLDTEDTYRVSSNIYQGSLGYAFKNDLLNIGIGGKFYFGNRILYMKRDYVDETFVDTKVEKEAIFKNAGLNIGVSKKINNYSFGLAYNSATKLDGDLILRTTGGEFDYENSTFDIPHSFVLGNSFQFSEIYKINFDSEYSLWNNADDSYRNTLKLSFGMAYDPLSGEDRWYKKIPVRAGVYHKQLPFEITNSSEYLNEVAYTFGLSIPLRSPKKKIDISLKYVNRGNIEDHIYEEDSVMLTLGLNGLDFFKKRFKKTKPRSIPQEDGSQKEF